MEQQLAHGQTMMITGNAAGSNPQSEQEVQGKSFLLCNKNGTWKIGKFCQSLHEIKLVACFEDGGRAEEYEVYVAGDGTKIMDDVFLLTLPLHTTLVCILKGQRWSESCRKLCSDEDLKIHIEKDMLLEDIGLCSRFSNDSRRRRLHKFKRGILQERHSGSQEGYVVGRDDPYTSFVYKIATRKKLQHTDISDLLHNFEPTEHLAVDSIHLAPNACFVSYRCVNVTSFLTPEDQREWVASGVKNYTDGSKADLYCSKGSQSWVMKVVHMPDVPDLQFVQFHKKRNRTGFDERSSNSIIQHFETNPDYDPNYDSNALKQEMLTHSMQDNMIRDENGFIVAQPVFINVMDALTLKQADEVFRRNDFKIACDHIIYDPQPGNIFLFRITSPMDLKHLNCDTITWKNVGHKTTNNIQVRYFQARMKNNAVKTFTKRNFLEEESNKIIIQYLGDNSEYERLPHGNARKNPSTYCRTSPYVLDAITKSVGKKPAEIFKDLKLDTGGGLLGAVLSPRNLKQVQNRRFLAKKTNRMFSGSYGHMLEMVEELDFLVE